MKKNKLSIVLVRPQLPENIGMVARVMNNFSFEDLIIVNPKEDWFSDKSINAAKKAMDLGFTKYTPGAGILDLRKAITEKLSRDNNLIYDPSEVIVSCGGKHSLYNACQVLFQSGDEVIIFSPYWVSFPDFVSVTGAKPIFVETNPEKQYEPNFKNLESKINKKTKEKHL